MTTTATKSKKPTTKTTSKSKKKKKKKPLPVCTKKDLKKKKSKRRKCRVKPKPKPTPKPQPTGPVAAPPVSSPSGDGWVPAPTPEVRTDGLRSYTGAFGAAQATRLLFRAGFGPTPGQAAEFAALGVDGAVERLLHPPTTRLEGPAPSGDYLVGGEFAPDDRWGHGHLEWLDRCVRSTDQLSERMALVMHDWIAIALGDVDASKLRPTIHKFRTGWRGSFRQQMLDITVDPAMLIWLNGLGSDRNSPNENYARELMELFCLGADRGAYTEADIREMARALTGWIADWNEAQGLHNFRYDARRWDSGNKTFFAGTPQERTGRFGWRDTVNAVIDHPMHASYVAMRLWAAFIPTAPTPQTLAELEALYRSSGERLEPLVAAILRHPDLYNGPSLTKSPVTYVAGLLRARRRGIDHDGWTWMCSQAGQTLLEPPNVSGWNERGWLNTTTYQARWWCASDCVREDELDWDTYGQTPETPAQAVTSALAFWGNPVISAEHRGALDALSVEAMSTDYWNDQPRRIMRQYSLRQLVVTAPDYQVS